MLASPLPMKSLNSAYRSASACKFGVYLRPYTSNDGSALARGSSPNSSSKCLFSTTMKTTCRIGGTPLIAMLGGTKRSLRATVADQAAKCDGSTTRCWTTLVIRVVPQFLSHVLSRNSSSVGIDLRSSGELFGR